MGKDRFVLGSCSAGRGPLLGNSQVINWFYPFATKHAVLEAFGCLYLMGMEPSAPWWPAWACRSRGELQFLGRTMKRSLGLRVEELWSVLNERPSVQHVVLDSTGHLDLSIVFSLDSMGESHVR